MGEKKRLEVSTHFWKMEEMGEGSVWLGWAEDLPGWVPAKGNSDKRCTNFPREAREAQDLGATQRWAVGGRKSRDWLQVWAQCGYPPPPPGLLLSPMQPGGWEDTGAVMGFNTGGWQRKEPGWQLHRGPGEQHKGLWEKWNMFEHITNIHDWHMRLWTTWGKISHT